MGIFEELGVSPVINAATTFTVLGGSLMPVEVLDAMRAAGRSFVDMHELHLKAGEELARLTRNDAAYVTSGCAAGLVLAILGARTGPDPRDIERLIAGEDLPDEVVMHAAHRIPYDPAVQLAGARIRTVGNVLQTFPWELEAAITDHTAAILFVAGEHLPPGSLPLEEVVAIGRSHGIPVIVDAAAQLPPAENLWRFTTEAGADVALFSGGKALRGPQASGLMVGTEQLVTAARAHGAPHQRLARAMKVGKEEVGGLVAAVRRYVALDHAGERDGWYATVEAWRTALEDLPGISPTIEHRNEAGQPVPRLRLEVDPAAAALTASELVERLRGGRPRIEVLPGGRDAFWISPDLVDGAEALAVSTAISTAVGGAARAEG